jgi:hypothetical protein
MRPTENIKKLIRDASIKTHPAVNKAVLNNLFDELDKSQKTDSAILQPSVWRIIMKSRITKFATAAVIITAVTVSIIFLNKSTAPAYAIEQSLQAYHSVRYLHIRDYDAQHSEEPREFWIECDEAGRLKNVRSYFPDWASGGDGPKVVVWDQGKAQIWLKEKNSLLVIRDEKVFADMLKFVQNSDPRLLVEHLYDMEKQNKGKLDINEPSDKTKDIKITVDVVSSGRRTILYVDRATKLVTATEFYQLKDGEYQYQGTMEFFDYNQPIDPTMFNLEKEIPADVTRVDQTTQEVGLEQGNLSKDEIVVEVAKQFFDALIAKDYAKAGKLLEGMPADKMEQAFGRIRFIRIVSIGKPEPHPIPMTQGVVVPCVVEIEADGKIEEQKFDQLGIRQVYNQPGRWTIFGGI